MTTQITTKTIVEMMVAKKVAFKNTANFVVCNNAGTVFGMPFGCGMGAVTTEKNGAGLIPTRAGAVQKIRMLNKRNPVNELTAIAPVTIVDMQKIIGEIETILK
jgi:hypothetical protein